MYEHSDQREVGTESKPAAPTTDDEPLYPASGPDRLDEQTQPVRNRELFRQRESHDSRN